MPWKKLLACTTGDFIPVNRIGLSEGDGWSQQTKQKNYFFIVASFLFAKQLYRLLQLSDALLQVLNLHVLFCDLVVFFEEFVEKHRVDGFVAHRVNLFFVVVEHQG